MKIAIPQGGVHNLILSAHTVLAKSQNGFTIAKENRKMQNNQNQNHQNKNQTQNKNQNNQNKNCQDQKKTENNRRNDCK